jgi:hypothetical protein
MTALDEACVMLVQEKRVQVLCVGVTTDPAVTAARY